MLDFFQTLYDVLLTGVVVWLGVEVARLRRERKRDD